MTIAELFKLTPEQIAGARAAITNLQKTMEPVIHRVAELSRNPDVQRALERMQQAAAQLAPYFQPYVAALSKLRVDPEWIAMIDGAAEMTSAPYVPTINVPHRALVDEGDEEPVEVRPHRRTGFTLPGVHDD